jgi:hypothetical protein
MKWDTVPGARHTGGAEAIVGAPYRDTVAGGTTYTDGGAVYIFQPTTGGGTVKTLSDSIWSTGALQSNAHFGSSVTFMDACFGPGTEKYGIAVGSPDEDSTPGTDQGTVSIWLN